jgi:hypothetical protein
MDEQAVRALVRDAIARHGGQGLPAQLGGLQARPPYVPTPSRQAALRSHTHPSHVLFAGLINVSDACVIEPAVTCDHCGYCKSHGH